MEPWYKVTTPRAEVREGRSFNPDMFAIALSALQRGANPQGEETRLLEAMLLAPPRR